MLSYYVIYYEKFRNIMQQTEKEALNWFVKETLNIEKVLNWTNIFYIIS